MLSLHASELPFQAIPGIYPLSKVLLRCNDAKKEATIERQRAQKRETQMLRWKLNSVRKDEAA